MLQDKYTAKPIEVQANKILSVATRGDSNSSTRITTDRVVLDENGLPELDKEGAPLIHTVELPASLGTPSKGDYYITTPNEYNYIRAANIFESKYHLTSESLLNSEENGPDNNNPAWNQPQAKFDNVSVNMFATAMKDKMALKRDQGFSKWIECPVETLMEKLQDQLAKESRDYIDIANFCMMLYLKTTEIQGTQTSKVA